MTAPASCAYTGRVVHTRITPKRHAFSYRVFSLCLDVDDIDRLDRAVVLFSRNRWNIVSFHDRDFGAKAAAGENVGAHIRSVLRSAGLAEFGQRILLLCYPRLFGYVFNPLSVYFCYAAGGAPGVIIYEVSNTFGERKSYVIVVENATGAVIAQTCAKEMYVSPFTHATAQYRFHVRAPAASVAVGIDLIDTNGPVLKTLFTGERAVLNAKSLLALVARNPLMTIKVIAGIHFEAARLWLKGVPLVPRYVSPSYSFTVIKPHKPDASHAH